ncbi:MAG TPA: PH domain-containing protein [Candidatus Moranbacteria bacterium]|nr:PH domain-containing protein [Candidatus Moranbacteria bacterium]
MNNFSKFHFKDLEKNETIINVLHRHWFYLLLQYIIVIAVMVIFMAGIFVLPALYPDFLKELDPALTSFGINFFILALWIYSFMIWIDYYFDIWIITSERIINIEQKGLFSRKASELRFRKIQDVTTEVVGFLPTIFNYGDVKIQTAGEQNEFIFRTIPDPYIIKNVIMDLQKKNEGRIGDKLESIIKDEIGG